MTGHELVSKFYLANLEYLKRHSSVNDPERESLVLFLLGMMETTSLRYDTSNDILEFLNDN